MALGLLVNGKWMADREQEDKDGRFLRPSTTFRDWISSNGTGKYTAKRDRYHLYVSLACPWAHRTLIMRSLKGLTDSISISVVNPYMGDEGWSFEDAPGVVPDPIHNAQYLRAIYTAAEDTFTGRVTVPILWDKKTGTIVNNESREIIRMLDTKFESIAKPDVDLCPHRLRDKIDETIDAIYDPINNGVYRAGFATTQNAYEEAVTELFHTLDRWESVLEGQRYLCGNVLTEADICMFTTLIRFDPVYYVHFKCNLRHIFQYPNLWGYLRDIYQTPGVAETCDFDHIKQHYYRSHPKVNPFGVVPVGPKLDLEGDHGRDRFTS
ncbi:MAG: glutathione S-transferase family protein [Kaiparowitsia implicata GSE-PSE-MK54-09C]|jgi:putative glutathione S-transferase|nr:glutathione S-transferase family protein [Kaiparowitsia implicata GSE-PSE-MK54-09C]